MAFSRIDHVALDVADLRRSIEFYVTHFGFDNYFNSVTPSGLHIAYLKLGSTVLELVGKKAQTMDGFHFCLISDGFDADVAKLEAAGLTYVMKPHPTDARDPGEEGWRRVVFAGPDGEPIEIRG